MPTYEASPDEVFGTAAGVTIDYQVEDLWIYRRLSVSDYFKANCALDGRQWHREVTDRLVATPTPIIDVATPDRTGDLYLEPVFCLN